MSWSIHTAENAHPVQLAPMVGLSHFVVRQALSEYLPPGKKTLWPTEMLNSRRIPHQKEDQVPETTFKDKANGLCPQLLGNEEDPIQESIKILEDWGALAIDINMGCPVSKALRHNYGVSLMGDIEYAARVTEYAVKKARVPISVKLRAGFVSDEKYLVQFTRALENAGAAWITLHPRTADQGRRGESDWNLIRVLKSELKIPVHGNGDIQCLEDIKKMIEATACDRVVIGRALTAKPWLMQYGSRETEPSNEEKLTLYRDFLLRVSRLAREHYSDADGMRRLRFLIFHGHVWLEFGHHFYAKTKHAANYDEFETTVQELLSRPQKFYDRTHLRG